MYAQHRNRPGEWDTQSFWDFEIQTNRLISARPCDSQQQKKKKKKKKKERKENLPNRVHCSSGRPQS